MIFGWLRKKRQTAVPKVFSVPILYLGKKIELRAIIEGRRAMTRLEDDILHMKIPAEPFSRRKLFHSLASWYKKEAKRLMTPLLVHLQNDYGYEYRRVSFKWLRSRFGSCSSRKNLNFNILLLQAPWEMIEYVIIHEYCHLRHMNHSKDFWSFVEEICPDYREKRKWLKTKGKHLFDFLRLL